jgi:hypothetical protein
MNRVTARLAAAVLAFGVTIAELIGIVLLAEIAPIPGTSLVVLPRVVISPADPREAPGEGRQAAAFGAPLPRT